VGRNRLEQDSFVKFKAYYGFEARFCNPGGGHEKGGVEGLVGFARRNYMVPMPEAADMEELNEKLLRQCLAYGDHRIAGRERTVTELYEEEKGHLLALPEIAFSNVQPLGGRVDKYATVIVDKNRYSVPSRYAGFTVKVLLFVDRVEIFLGTKKLAVHERVFGITNGVSIPIIIWICSRSGRWPSTVPDRYGNGARAGRRPWKPCGSVSVVLRGQPRGSRTSLRF